MTSPAVGPEKRVADFNSQQAAYQKNAEMRGGYSEQTEQIRAERKAMTTIGENIQLREELATARKARDAAQELVEATRSELAKIEADGAQQAFSMGEAMGAAIRQKATLQSSLADARGECHRLKHDLDTEKLLRVNDAATIADLERRLREAEGQLKAQRSANASVTRAAETELRCYEAVLEQKYAAENAELEKMVLAKNDEIANLDKQLKAQTPGRLKRMHELSASEVDEIRAYVPYGDRVARAENVELRRTISLMAKTAAEVQDNFRLIAELAADPADQNRKENTK